MLTSFPSPTAAQDRPILVRKPDSPEVNDWQPISGAALKKNKKFVDAHWKKVKKAEENKEATEKAEREREERDAKRREEAAKIILKEDTSLPAAPKVSLKTGFRDSKTPFSDQSVLCTRLPCFTLATHAGQDRTPRRVP